MEASIFVQNVELTPRLQQYVEKKTGRLDRYMPTMTELRVDLASQKARNSADRQIAQITVRDRHGLILRAEEHHSDMFAAVDAVVDKIYRQIKRYRGKRIQTRRSGSADVEPLMGEALPIEDESDVGMGTERGAIVRRKRFTIQPMSAEEAIDQMELLGHDFFVFHSVEEDKTCVLYRRHNGDYGLIVPELD